MHKRHDVETEYEAFLAPFPKDKKLDILDLGCGPGRDVNYFQSLGHGQLAWTVAKYFCSMAAGTPVVRFFIKSFLAWNYPSTLSMASLPMPLCFMFPVRNCQKSFMTYTHIKASGILFLSNPRGNGEGWSGHQYGHYMQLATSKLFLRTQI